MADICTDSTNAMTVVCLRICDEWKMYYGRMLIRLVIAAIQAYLKELNGQGTVPHVYINKEFIGGSSDLLKLSHEQVKKKISAVSSA